MRDAGQSGAVRFAPGVVVQVIDGEALVLHLGTESVYSLDASGAHIAQLIDEGLTTSEIVARLSVEFQADPAVIARDVRGLIGELMSRGLLVADTSLENTE